VVREEQEASRITIVVRGKNEGQYDLPDNNVSNFVDSRAITTRAITCVGRVERGSLVTTGWNGLGGFGFDLL